MHPLRRGTPVTSRCTRSEEVQCLQIGCTASHNKPNRGQFVPTDPNRPPRTLRHSFDMLARLRTRGAAPVTSRRTRYVALHPLRSDAPDQKGCNAYRSGAPPPTTSPTAGNSSPQTPTVHLGRCDTASTCSPDSEREALHPLRRDAPVMSRCTRYVATHPLCRNAPVMSQCTRSEEVQCLQIGCTASRNKHNRETFHLARSRASFPSATGAALLSQFSSPGPGRPAATWRGERPRRRHPDPCRTGHLR